MKIPQFTSLTSIDELCYKALKKEEERRGRKNIIVTEERRLISGGGGVDDGRIRWYERWVVYGSSLIVLVECNVYPGIVFDLSHQICYNLIRSVVINYTHSFHYMGN